MITKDKRIRIIVGHYGSGKSEFAVNYALQLAKARKDSQQKVAISDLDVVNPYFRSREKEDLLRSFDIVSYSSVLRNSTLDVPAVSPELRTPIIDPSYAYVMDVGGDAIGSRVLGSMQDIIKGSDYDMFMVINANREYTQDAESVRRYMREIMSTSGLQITGLISNTHLIWDTTTEEILKGVQLVQEVSELTGIPFRYTVCPNYLDISGIRDQIPTDIFVVDMLMREKWM